MRLIMGEMSGCLAADIVSYCFCCCLNRFVDKFKDNNNNHYIIIIYYCFCCCLNRFIVMRLWCGRRKWQRWRRFVIDDNDKDGNDNDDDRSMRKILIMLISSCLLRLLGSKGLNCKMDGKVRSLSTPSLLYWFKVIISPKAYGSTFCVWSSSILSWPMIIFSKRVCYDFQLLR